MAHIPDGFLSPPVLAGTAVLSAAALAVATRRSRSELGDREVPLAGAATAFVFAAQMFNFPIAAGTSAHLLGGVLVAVLLGPWVAMLVMLSVVLVQALVFQDGGMAALGANVLNLSVLGTGGGWLLYRGLLAATGGSLRARVASAAVAACGSAVLIGVGVAAELALSGAVRWGPALVVVGGVHVVVGLGEGAITAAVLLPLLRARPELLRPGDLPATTLGRWATAGTAAAMVVAVAATLFASSRPDALEAAADRFGLHSVTPSWALLGPSGGLALAVLGVALAFGAGWLLLRSFARS
ncbi:MAG: energy-coupling factor ABC transporter permease [Longimicrobiales bacterium]|nr:energy-coupling factor ABC transporter permease [Longimicrobiales bacterium]